MRPLKMEMDAVIEAAEQWWDEKRGDALKWHESELARALENYRVAAAEFGPTPDKETGK